MNDQNYLTDLILNLQKDEQPKYLFFWGHTPKQKNMIDKSCFSQWYPAAFQLDGIDYPTAEHYMMAEKAKLFQDDNIFQQIIASKHPNDAKKLGRKVKGYDDTVWLKYRFDIVVVGNLAKFSQHTELKNFLLDTQQRILVEASPVDKIWGIGLSQDDPRANDPRQWQGLNLLGFALMQVRSQLEKAK